MSDTSSSARISLLGGVQIERPDGRLVDPLPRKCQELLAALALDPGTSITVSRLVALIWGDDPPRTAEKTLQTYVARLRRELGRDAIVRTGAAYRLDVDPASIDTSRFRSALGLGNVDAALREWKGVPLAGIGATSLQPLLDRLTEEWLDAIEGHLTDEVDRDPGTTTGRLTELVAAHPFREGLWALLMTALYRAGRQAEALDAYRRARSTLVEDLGVEPSARLRDLEQLILRQADELEVQTTTDRRRSAVDPPSGTVTFGFVEVDGAGALWASRPTQAADVLAAFTGAISALTEEHEGLVFTSGADTTGAAFGRAADACAWALAIHRVAATTTWPHSKPLGVRVGLHTGEAEERNGSYFGPAVTVARQLATVGAPGQSIATSITAVLSGSQHEALGTFSIDGGSSGQPLHQIGQGSFPPIAVSKTLHDRVPRPPHALLGRDDLVDKVMAALVDESAAVTLVGPGGIGKTRLAIEIARRSEPSNRRTWFVSLAEIANPEDTLRAVADTLGARESPDRNLLEAAVAMLAARPSLLLLDNCEHVIDGVGELVTELIDRCPSLTILATSREGLGVPTERLVPIGPLDPAGTGADLFFERAQAIDPSLHLDRRAVETVCRRLDGVPLAIELAAAAARTLSPEDLIERLDNMFSLLTGSRRVKLERHRTLRATTQWSYDLLSTDQQLLFRRLGVFTGPFDLRAAEYVAADDRLPSHSVGALLSDLVDRSMCLVESGTSGRRFRLLEPMRQFALDEVDKGEADLRKRHAEHIRHRVSAIHLLLAGPDETVGAARLAELWPNLRSALDWALDSGDLALATGLVEPVAAQAFMRQGLGEVGDWIERILELADPDDDETIGTGLLWISLYAQLTEDRRPYDRIVQHTGRPDEPLALLSSNIIDGDSEGILAQLPAALEAADRRGDEILGPILKILEAGNLLQAGRLDEVDDHLRHIIDHSEDSLPPTLLTWVLFMTVLLRDICGDHRTQNDLYDRIATTPLPPRTNSPTPTLAARRAARLGDHSGALEILSEHIDDLIAGDNPNGALIVAAELANILASTGRLAEAGEILGQLDAVGVDDVGGFDSLLTEARSLTSTDAVAAEARTSAANRRGDLRALLHSMATLTEARRAPT